MTPRPRPDRRSVLRAGAVLAGAGLVPRPRSDDVRLAVVGLNGIGRIRLRELLELPGARVTALCDVDERVLGSVHDELDERGVSVGAYSDLRRVLERADVDAVVLATPDHWHALQILWSLAAGKDVFVEAPLTHTLEEGRRVAAAAAESDRVVSVGFDARAHDALAWGIARLVEGALGPIQRARAIVHVAQRSIGSVEGNGEIPATLDYELWTGPAPLVPLRRQRVHHDWRYDWSTGGGELVARGVHALDLARWALGERGLPRSAVAVGGRFGYQDDGRTPNTALVLFDYASAPLVLELRGLPRNADEQAAAWTMDAEEALVEGARIECAEGTLSLGVAGSAVARDPDGVVLERWEATGSLLARFLELVRARPAGRGQLDDARISGGVAQLATISQRLATPLEPSAAREAALQPEREAFARAFEGSFERMLVHLEANGIGADGLRLVSGPWVSYDVAGDHCSPDSARKLESRSYREPFVLP